MALKTTIQFRRDTLSAWNEVNANTEGGLILKSGEIALVDLNNGDETLGKKWVIRIGDGKTPFDQLPETAYALASDVADQLDSVISSHEADIEALYKAIEDGLSGNTEALEKAVEDLSAGISSTHEELTGSISTARTEISAGIDSVKEELTGLVDTTKTDILGELSTADSNLSAGISAVKAELTGLIDGVETKVDEKIKVAEAEGDGTAIDTLTIRRVSAQEYHNIVVEADKSGVALPEDTLYIVSSDNINAFGEKIINVGDATDLSDAVNLKQLNEVSASLYNQISAISEFAGGNVAEIISNIGEISSEVETIISATIPELSDALNTKINGVAVDVATLSNNTIPALGDEIDAVSASVEGILTATIPELEGEIAGLSTSLSAYEIAVSASTDDENKLKSWTFTQGGQEVAKIELPFDVFVNKGTIEKCTDEDGNEINCLHLELNDVNNSIVEIPLTHLVDIYTANNDASETIDVTIENFKVSAEVRDGSIATAKLADKAVTADKIADGTITGVQISANTIDQTKLTGEFVFDCGGAAG